MLPLTYFFILISIFTIFWNIFLKSFLVCNRMLWRDKLKTVESNGSTISKYQQVWGKVYNLIKINLDILIKYS